MAKLIIVTLAVLCFAASSLAWGAGGAQDVLGNYYDATTGQISSSLTGKVYNTRPTGWGPSPLVAAHAPLVAAHSPLVAAYSAPIAAHYASPYVASYAAPLAYGAYAPSAAYLLKK
ncbi:hypothetical protein HDE_13240 [Halotydeus destructor]|nr:hypothetical protein HDE_13240 [Halotydeus destructor]